MSFTDFPYLLQRLVATSIYRTGRLISTTPSMPGKKRPRPQEHQTSQIRHLSSPLSSAPPSPLLSNTIAVPTNSLKTKKLKLLSDFSQVSPFPEYVHPTPDEAIDVHAILSRQHPKYATMRQVPAADDTSNSATSCGAVPNVLDSLIGTILSQNTSSRNSSAAKQSLDTTFGRHDFKAIALASNEKVVDAIRLGGLANRKAATIQRLLREVFKRRGEYSLQHLTDKEHISDAKVMEELVSYDGVGPKTAACVLLFCLGRDAFAVDTHVYRLSRLLGWVPTKANRIQAQMHLDVRVPKELKYALHVLMVQHGRACKGCKGVGLKGTPCVLKDHIKQMKGAIGSDPLDAAKEADEMAASS